MTHFFRAPKRPFTSVNLLIIIHLSIAKQASTPTPAPEQPKPAAAPKPAPAAPASAAPQQPQGGSTLQQTAKKAPTEISGTRVETRVRMSKMRQTIARRLKEAQNTNALLTTFNEIDMGDYMDMRKEV